MSSQTRRYLFPMVLCAVLLALIAFIGYNRLHPDNGLRVVGTASKFALQDLNGQPFSSDSLDGTVQLMEFIFTSCPDICPATSYNMVLIQNKLKDQGLFGDKMKMIAVTFDPERDTPDVLRNYAAKMKMDMSGWVLLRGEETETANVAGQYGVTVQNLGNGQFVHNATSLILIDRKQRIRSVYKMGMDMDNDRIVRDIKALLKERV
ncbi:SCO family protein [Cohnella hashimotonis]|uniref:SCO family protein n=1 Tax=Cohnella hashimotonis TaxID=2826895 RepID=A0ABT6TKZ5_9BACL|nr:SCO family protein [Cohnella hashimotonis]MDI4647384.1 SCO family protein [Cohnella hashimotonis]